MLFTASVSCDTWTSRHIPLFHPLLELELGVWQIGADDVRDVLIHVVHKEASISRHYLFQLLHLNFVRVRARSRVMYGAACGSWASYQVRRAGEAVHKDANAFEDAFLLPACCLLLLLELLIQLLILLLHVRSKAIF